MVGPACKCANCGHVFQTGLISICNAVGVTFEGCSASCPRCGGMAAIADGTYSAHGNTLRLDAGPLSTRQIISELSRVAQKAREERLSTEEVLAELVNINPDLAKKLKSIGPWPVVGLIILLFWLVKSFTLDLKIDVNWLIDQAWHVSHGQDPDQHIGTSPPKFRPGPALVHQPETSPSKQDNIPSRAPNRHARRQAEAQARKAAGHRASRHSPAYISPE